MKIAYVSFEVVPFAKVGGLADVAGALPKYLKKRKNDVFVVMPFHKVVRDNFNNLKLISEDFVPLSHELKQPFSVYESKLPESDVVIYFIKNNELFNTKDIYGGRDLALQSSYFCDSVLKFIKEIHPDTDLINVNDWQTSLIPAYLKNNYFLDDILGNIKTVLTIHNLGYQGIFTRDKFDFTGLPDFIFNPEYAEFYGYTNYLKLGIIYSDIVNTVSKTYAEEIQTAEFGYQLDGVLRSKKDFLYGIINGIDYEEYNPLTDKRIFKPIKNYNDKIENKLKLQEKLDLKISKDVPVISLISRLYDQKGLDLIQEIIEYSLALDFQFVILGTGDKKYEDFFNELSKRYPKQVSSNLFFDLDLAQKIYAGSDMFLMPSLYEPCGLGQMYSMRYGTVPIVRYTGGLADTVIEFYEEGNGNGFGFYDYTSKDLLNAITKAVFYYKKRNKEWKKLFDNCMKSNFSYETTALNYEHLYKVALELSRGGED
ncbi:glycogen synthase [Oceanotoga sp. DSM 15011]|uniref:glycogen synthase n=1 Tax=Oceanotoga sp. DSM 15011 TaxID=2984951 RepID=UPI0021F460AE|nr:glycogen/starch synthase [Oceanotoga sp. DSM 15011]UYO99661.1 glycogen synthase [Oceanotoga sp. DSM 15011]